MVNKSRKIQLRVGAYYEHRGQFSEAKKWYSKAAKRPDPETSFRLGNLEYRMENYSAAVSRLRQAVNGGGASFEALKRLALSLEKLGDRYGAEELIHSEVIKSPDDSRLKELMESLRARNGQHELRQLSLEKAASSPGDVGENGNRHATSPVSKDDPAWLQADFLSARLDDRRDEPDWLYNYGNVLEEAGRLAEAASIFDEACALAPTRSWWWYRSGRAYELSGNQIKARQRYLRAVEHDSKHDSRKWGIGVFHHESGIWDMAGREFEGDARDASEVWRRAGLLFRAGHNHLLAVNFEDAERCLERALRLRPRNMKWNRMLADTLELQGKFADAVGVLELLMTSGDISEADRRSASWAAGRIHHKTGNYEASISQLRCALEISEIASQSDIPRHSSTYLNQDAGFVPDATTNRLFQGSTDRRGHTERAQIASELHESQVEVDCLRRAELLSGTNDIKLAERYSRRLVEAGDHQRAAEVLLRTRVHWGPYPDEYAQPRENSYSYQLAAYKQWRAELPMEQDVVLYETNLGLSIDCNPLAVCRHLLNDKQDLLHVWASDGEVTVPEDLLEHANVLVVQKNSLQYIRLLATAKYLINNSTFPTYFTRRDEQRYLMTWHGTPQKTLAKDMSDPLIHLNMARNYLQATHAIFPNQHTREVLVDGMDLTGLLSAQARVTGYPRNDILARCEPKNIAPAPGSTVLYAPTWREDSELERQVEALIKVREIIIAAGHKPLIRAHHYVESAAYAVDPEISFVPRRIPTNDLLPEVDILITDFSSIYFDFAITHRPVIFYTPDWDQYAESRGLYFNKEQLPGPVSETIDELRAALDEPYVDMSARREFLDEFAPKEDGFASRHVSEWFMESTTEETDSFDTGLDKSEQGSKGILIRQAFIPNGMTSSFINLVTSLNDLGVKVTVLTDGRSVQDEPGRQVTLSRLPEQIQVIGRVGMQPKSMIEYHGSQTASRIVGSHSQSLEALLEGMYQFEADRVLPVAGFDSVIEFDGYSEFMARLVYAIGRNSTQTAIYLHNDIYDEIRLRMPELKGVVEILPKFDHVVAVSQGSSRVNAEKLSRAYGIDTSKFTYARNAILPDQIVELGSATLPVEVQEFLTGSDISVVQVGRISPEKNHSFSLDLMAEIRANGTDCRLVIVGDGPLKQAMATRVRELGLETATKFVGWVENPYPFIANADAMLLPSHHEGQPMVILEAQTLGTPVIGSNISSLEAMGDIGPRYLLPLELKQWSDCLTDLIVKGKEDQIEFDGVSYLERSLEEFFVATGIEYQHG